MEIRKSRGAVFSLNYHLVFVTKYRREVFTEEALAFLGDRFEKICADFNCDLVEFNGEPDHVHLLVSAIPKVAISSIVNSLKGASSRAIRKEMPQLKSKFYGKEVLWSPSYFVSTTGGAPLDEIRKYIKNQEAA